MPRSTTPPFPNQPKRLLTPPVAAAMVRVAVTILRSRGTVLRHDPERSARCTKLTAQPGGLRDRS